MCSVIVQSVQLSELLKLHLLQCKRGLRMVAHKDTVNTNLFLGLHPILLIGLESLSQLGC